MKRERLTVRGVVQGVGFRPFVYRLASSLGLAGFVKNIGVGVVIEVEGAELATSDFARRLRSELPHGAQIWNVEHTAVSLTGKQGFSIEASEATGKLDAVMLPDTATCADCLREVFDPLNRRFGYAFTTCTLCGPRYSISLGLPFDRANTTMNEFVMCKECESEYRDPASRRFHSQTNSCARCGPRLRYVDARNAQVTSDNSALEFAASQIRAGKVLAVKGIGGFHLVASLKSPSAIATLRQRKRRPDKPFAIMARDLEQARALCFVDEDEASVLTSDTAPIVLLRKRETENRVAPGLIAFGVMLAYTPLHQLLLEKLDAPIVCTSGNASGDPLCTQDVEALEALSSFVDGFVFHDRRITRQVDDSIVRIVARAPMVMRRARGYAPLAIPFYEAQTSGENETLLAVGPQLKNTIGLLHEGRAYLSAHLGNLETKNSCDNFELECQRMTRYFNVSANAVACDAHPDYHATRYACALPLRHFKVQHHLAHVLSNAVENGLKPPFLGVAWDGTGLGTHNDVWGGEFFVLHDFDVAYRVAHLRPFQLLGGDLAAREPRRVALALARQCAELPSLSFFQAWRTANFSALELGNFERVLKTSALAMSCTSAGRLFDGIAALLGVRARCSFEAQAAMELEALANDCEDAHLSPRFAMPLQKNARGALEIDWRTLVTALAQELERGETLARLAKLVHFALAQSILDVATAMGVRQVLLTGGVFQNKVLAETTVSLLARAGFETFTHHRVPPGDGGIALGQLAACYFNTRVASTCV